MFLYQNQIINSDCLAALQQIPDETIDLTVFSPPYDKIREYKKNWHFDYPKIGQELYRVTKDGGVAVVVIGDGTKNFAKSLTSFRLVLDWVDHAHWQLFETVIYQRAGNPGAWWSRRFRVDHEYIFIFFKGAKPKTFHKEHLAVPSKHAGKTYTGTDRLTNGQLKAMKPKTVNATKCRGTIWHYATSNSEGNRLKMKHPATYPDKLASDLICCFSNPTDLVLDPMCGSGTTCVMAQKNQRQFVGIDIGIDYCEIASARLTNEK